MSTEPSVKLICILCKKVPNYFKKRQLGIFQFFVFIKKYYEISCNGWLSSAKTISGFLFVIVSRS